MAGTERSSRPLKVQRMFEAVEEMGFSLLPFDKGAVAPFGRFRGKVQN